MTAATCQAALDGVGNGVAAGLHGVDCAASQMAESAFARLFGTSGALLPALTILLTIYVALFALALVTGRSRIGINSMTSRLVTIGLVLTFATSWIAYQSVVWNLATGAPNELAGILTGTPGNATDVFAAKIDVVFQALIQASNGQTADSAFSPPGLLWVGGTLLLLGTVGILATSRIALAVLLALGPVFVVLALFAPWIAPYDPIATSFATVRKAPSAAHWFGTDEIGRDVFARVVFGARASLLAGVVSVLISLSIGVPVGLVAGYAGGATDMLISRVTDALLACPFLILAIALAAFLGPSLTNAMIAIGISATPIFIRLTRGTTLAIKAEDFVLAARAIGNPPWRIAIRHVLPNIVPPLLVQATLAIAAAVIAEASLSFLGLGQQPPQPSWGSMLNTAKNYIDNAPWMAVWPGVSIFLLVLSFNVVGDGLRDALDPHHA